MAEILNYKTITVTGHLGNNQNSFTFNINNLEFQPDEVVVRLLLGNNELGAITDYMYIIKSDLVDNNVLAPMSATAVILEPVNIPHKLVKPINGIYTFSIYNYDGTIPGDIALFNLTIGISLLFIKYKTPYYLRK